ncbi:MAG: M81 family metallopeptidase [Betaproteobacteria bacterium]|nr:M81 family metallopeptidase [Betaproteobacteria bacterium]
MRIFYGSLQTETNTFAPFPTGLASFEEGGLFRGNGSTGTSPSSLTARALQERALREGHDFHQSLQAEAQPSGRILTGVYERLRDELLSDLASGTWDVVFLFLHGAMAAEGYDDCEGDIISRARAIVGPDVPIGVELDLHCHLTSQMVDAANAIVIFKEYPHTDYVERANELLDICIWAKEGRIRPVSRVRDCGMIGFYPTTSQPMRRIVDGLQTIEARPGVLSVSIAHGFPWADVPDVGTKVLAITDGDVLLAEAVANEVGDELWAERENLRVRFPDMSAAIERAMSIEGCVVLGDTADNPGGGAPGDATFLLQTLLERDLTDIACGVFWDPGVVAICKEAGVGASFPIRLGGKCGVSSGSPIDIVARVTSVVENHTQTGLSGSRRRMGDAVCLTLPGNVDIAVCSFRLQTLSPDAFTGLGIDLLSKKIVAVKSSHHFYANFQPVAADVIHVATPGAMSMRFEEMPYTKRGHDYFPRTSA